MKNLASHLCLGLVLTLAAAAALTLAGCASDHDDYITGGLVDDNAITAQVQKILKANGYEGVQAVSFKGIVQLSGPVDNLWLKFNATSVALKVPGVRSVDNNLTVKGGTGLGANAGDLALSQRVNSALISNGDYKFERVNVTARNGTVQLSGFVNTPDQKALAGNIASRIEGVQTVQNDVAVKDQM